MIFGVVHDCKGCRLCFSRLERFPARTRKCGLPITLLEDATLDEEILPVWLEARSHYAMEAS